VKIFNQTRQTLIAINVTIADSFLSRQVGLLRHACLSPDEAMIITQCRQIHMFFMKFAIDVIFVDAKDRVTGLVKAIRPFRMSPYFWRARYVIECHPGVIDASKTEKGDMIWVEGWAKNQTALPLTQ